MTSRKQASSRTPIRGKKSPAKKTPAKAPKRTADVTPPSDNTVDNSELASARRQVCGAAVAASPAIEAALQRLQSAAGSKDLALVDPVQRRQFLTQLENLVIALSIYGELIP